MSVSNGKMVQCPVSEMPGLVNELLMSQRSQVLTDVSDVTEVSGVSEVSHVSSISHVSGVSEISRV